VTRGPWTVRLSDTAEADYDEILLWTARRFGATQATSYGRLIATALAHMVCGPKVAGARRRDEIGAGVLSLHIGRRARHIVLFRVGSEAVRTIDVLRILHDAMDVVRHVARDT
jgi:toxin ParE1/3/4